MTQTQKSDPKKAKPYIFPKSVFEEEKKTISDRALDNLLRVDKEGLIKGGSIAYPQHDSFSVGASALKGKPPPPRSSGKANKDYG